MEHSSEGKLLQRALELRAALQFGITITLAEIPADECQALRVIEEETARFHKEQEPKQHG